MDGISNNESQTRPNVRMPGGKEEREVKWAAF
jgi:hypothetical protein